MKNRQMSTCNQLVLETLRSRLVMSKNLPRHCYNINGGKEIYSTLWKGWTARAQMGADAVAVSKFQNGWPSTVACWGDRAEWPKTLNYMDMCNMLRWHGPKLVNYIHITPVMVFSAMYTIDERSRLDAWRPSSVMSTNCRLNTICQHQLLSKVHNTLQYDN